MTSFDKDSAFLPETIKIVKEHHELHGHFGSSLLSLREDLKIFCATAKIHNLGLSVAKKGDSCQEQYVIRLTNHLLKVLITSHKPGVWMPTCKSPDTAKGITKMQEGVRTAIARPYAQPLATLAGAIFFHNADSCTFQVDSDEGEWSMFFQDAKNRTSATIDIYPHEEATYPAKSIALTGAAKKPKAPSRKPKTPAVLQSPSLV